MKVSAGLRVALCVASGALTVMPTSVLAQAEPVVPPAPTRDEIDRPELRRDSRPPVRFSVEGGIERAPCPLDEPRFQNIRVTVSNVQFDGLGAISPAALRPSYESFVGTSQPISVVCEIRDAATAILRQQGYLAAVQVPPQRIENGEIRFHVLLGKLVSVHLRGDAGPAERTLASYLERIKAQEVFNTHEAERYLLLARDLPGYDVRLVLKPAGTAPGELVGEVLVERRPLEVDFNVQNYGSKDVGRFGGMLRANLYGLTGLADRTTLAVYSTADFKEQQIYHLSHDFRLGSEGVSLGGRLAYAITRPSLAENTPITAKTLLATVQAGYGFVRSQAGNLRAFGGLELVNQKIRFLGSPLSEDRLRVLFLRLDFDATDPRSLRRGGDRSIAEPLWRFAGSLELRKGVDIFGASKGCGPQLALCADRIVRPIRAEGDPDAALVRFVGAAELRPMPNVTFALSPRAQYSSKPLFAFEEFTGGNYTVGRGYDPGAIAGDSGVGFQAELRVGSLRPRNAKALAFQPFAFVDSAWVWNEDRLFARSRSDKLTSVGGGVRAAYGDRALLDLAAAVPTRRTALSERKGDVRVLMSLTVRLWPWTRE